MDEADLHCLLRDALGIAPGDGRPPPLREVPAPPWTRPFSRFMWDRMWSWANAMDGRQRDITLTLVPVWAALAEEVWDRRWYQEVYAVHAQEDFVVIPEPTRPLDEIVQVALTVTDAAAVMAFGRPDQRPPEHFRVARRMGPYSAVVRPAAVSLRAAPTVLPSAPLPRPEAEPEPWTQYVRPRAALDALPPDRREAVRQVLWGCSDDHDAPDVIAGSRLGELR